MTRYAALAAVFGLCSATAAAPPQEPTPADLIRAATTGDWPVYPVLPSLSTEMRGNGSNEIPQNPEVRAAYALLGAKNRRNVEWFEGVARLEKLRAVWCLQSCLCHPHEDVQIHALRALERLGDRRAVPFLLLYADYVAVYEDGSENATIHGVIHRSVAKTLSTLTGIEWKVEGQDPEGLKKGIRKWRLWLMAQEAE